MKTITIKLTGTNSLTSRSLKKGAFNHITGNQYRILPYKTNPGGDEFTEDFKTFEGVVGELFRLSQGKNLTDNIKSEHSYNSTLKNTILENAIKKVDTENHTELKAMLSKLFFDEEDNLIKFSGHVVSYLNFHNPVPSIRELSKYIYDIFFASQFSVTDILKDGEKDNLLHQLVIESLPGLEDAIKKSNNPYLNLFPGIGEQVAKDLDFMKTDKAFFLKHIEDFFKYSYFHYVSQLVLRFNSFGVSEDKITPIYFTLDWEAISESRLVSHSVNWKSLNRAGESLFTHANTLELLNYIFVDDKPVGDYYEILRASNDLSENEKQQLLHYVNEITSFYTENITNFRANRGWEHCDSALKESSFYKNHDGIIKAIYALWYKIRYQFENTERRGAEEKYAKWFTTFAKVNYTRNRGRLGATTSLSQEQLLFLTRLCIGSENKIRLNLLWDRMRSRGIVFDETSKLEITKLFERINLIEKKSDSGDAQYIKSTI